MVRSEEQRGKDPSGEGFWAGVDVGAATTKAVILDVEKRTLGWDVRRSGIDYVRVSEQALDRAVEVAGIRRDRLRGVFATGYGRHNVTNADEARTEISCHVRGAFHFRPHAAAVVDIGGQDCKVIHVSESGRRTGFKMNRKCAAGTGAFLEEIALRLGLELSNLNDLAARSEKRIRIGSYCTVFSATEILALIRRGEKVEDIARGVFDSIVERVLEMNALSEVVVLTGGVIQHNPVLQEIMQERLGHEVVVPPMPQLMGAFGAALLARERSGPFQSGE
jgi:predicted CoA-substrate-specific enzyme activase